MTTASPIFCNHCGAANDELATQCLVCGQPPLTPVTPAPQTVLKQRYLLVKRIGRGGFGAVYQAEDTELGNRVLAIKEMNLLGLGEQEMKEAVETFKREALMLAGLMHSHLPRIYDHFAENNRWYLVMDFIAGETLDDYLAHKAGDKLPLDEVLAIALQLCSVLDYLHTRQPPIIFRDLKPSNVMRAPDGQLYLIDFGIARHFKPGQAKDTIAFGSPGYAAPEQYGKTQTRPSADIYSLGAMMHQMLTGVDPSITPFFFEPLHLHGYPTQSALEQLLKRMLDMNATQRVSSVNEVRQALQQIMQQPLTPVYNAVNVPAAQNKIPSSPSIKPTTARGFVQLAYKGHAGKITCLGWSPDGTHIASAGKNGRIEIWEVVTGRTSVTYYGHSGDMGWPSSLSWSPDGACIVSTSAGDGKAVHVWDTTTGKLLFAYTGHRRPTHLAEWSPDGKYIASGSDDHTIQVWDANTGNHLFTRLEGHGGFFARKFISALAWSPDSQRIVSSDNNRVVRVWDAFTGKIDLMYVEHASPVTALAWSPNKQYIASLSSKHDDPIHIWSPTRTSKEQIIARSVSTYYDHMGNGQWAELVAWSPDGTRIASASGGVSATIHIWDLSLQNTFIYRKHHDPVKALAWSPDGTRIASSDDATVYIWQAV